jgi:hypothetical protein
VAVRTADLTVPGLATATAVVLVGVVEGEPPEGALAGATVPADPEALELGDTVGVMLGDPFAVNVALALLFAMFGSSVLELTDAVLVTLAEVTSAPVVVATQSRVSVAFRGPLVGL